MFSATGVDIDRSVMVVPTKDKQSLFYRSTTVSQTKTNQLAEGMRAELGCNVDISLWDQAPLDLTS